MKKIILSGIIIICLQVPGVAQKAMVGVSGGMSFANMNASIGGQKVTGNARPGAMFGLLIDVPVKGPVNFMPGIYYVHKGQDDKQDINDPNTKTAIALRYAEVQFNFVYNTRGQKLNVFGGVGPYIAMALPSKRVTKVGGGEKTYTELTFGNTGVEDYQGFDFGANFVAGLRHSCGVFLAFNYSQGLNNIVSDPNDNSDKIRNNYIGVQIGIIIKNK
jgi:hypothetical protein